VPNAPAPRPAAGKGSDPGGQAVKLLPPLTITDAELDQGWSCSPTPSARSA